MKVRLLQGMALAAVLIAAACAPAPAPTSGTPADEATLRALGGKFADAWNKGDIPALVAMATEDYDVVSPDGMVIKGRAAFEKSEKEQLTQRTGLPLKLTVNTSYVKWGGANAASLGGTWTMAGLPPGLGADKGSWTVFAVKGTDGEWRMSSGLVANATPPAAPPAAPATGKGK